MARHQEKKPSRGILWRILLALAGAGLFILALPALLIGSAVAFVAPAC